MAVHVKAVFRSDRIVAVGQLTVAQFDHRPAAIADQVMMVLPAAAPVGRLTLVLPNLIDDTGIREAQKGAIDGRQAHVRALVESGLVDLLSGHGAPTVEGSENRHALGRHPQSMRPKSGSRIHAPMIARSPWAVPYDAARPSDRPVTRSPSPLTAHHAACEPRQITTPAEDRMRPELFSIGPFTLYSFGLMAALALIVPGILAARDLRERGYEPGLSWEIILGAGIGGFIGARLNYLIEHDFEGGLFSATGLVWYGGVIGGAVGVLIVAAARKLPIGTVANVAAPGLALGYAIGRIGCQLAGDGDYGAPTSLPWGMSYPDGTVPTTETVHPTPVYETLAMFVVFAILWKLRKRLTSGWQLFGLWCVLQSIERFLVEFVRRNDEVALGLTTPQIISVVIAAVGVVILVMTRGGHRPGRTVAAVWAAIAIGAGPVMMSHSHDHGHAQDAHTVTSVSAESVPLTDHGTASLPLRAPDVPDGARPPA